MVYLLATLVHRMMRNNFFFSWHHDPLNVWFLKNSNKFVAVKLLYKETYNYLP